MASRFSIFQYVPDPITNERINIGVTAFSDDEIRVRFLNNWGRVQKFSINDIDFLKEFAAQAHQEIPLLQEKEETTFHDCLIKISREWTNSIQVTEPRASLKDVDSLFDYICQRFLVEPQPVAKKPFRGRYEAKHLATSTARKVLKSFDARNLLKTSHIIRGNQNDNEFDVVVENSKPYFSAHGISFEVNEPQDLLEALAWRIDDIKKYNSDFPIGVIMLSPVENSPDYSSLLRRYEKTSNMYQNSGADIVSEEETENWFTRQSSLVFQQ